MEINELLKDKIENAAKVFQQSNLFKHILIPEFDCSILTNPETTDGKDLPEEIKSAIFSYLHQYDKIDGCINDFPCIYIFELVNLQDRQRALDSFQEVGQSHIERTLPALRTRIPESKFLYIGKVETHVGGRLVTHMGYYQSKGNHGLQLAFWASKLQPALKINIHIMRFRKEFTPYVNAFEVIIAKELKPIIGKH